MKDAPNGRLQGAGPKYDSRSRASQWGRTVVDLTVQSSGESRVAAPPGLASLHVLPARFAAKHAAFSNVWHFRTEQHRAGIGDLQAVQ